MLLSRHKIDIKFGTKLSRGFLLLILKREQMLVYRQCQGDDFAGKTFIVGKFTRP